MIGFANLALLGGVVLAAAPVLVHIAHRRRFRIMRWGAMRFLADLMVAQRKRLHIEHWTLLGIRVLALLCLALALCRPIWTGPELASTLDRQGAVAAVLLIDDSLSSSAGRGTMVFEEIQRLADAYLASLGKGDEISIVTTSRRGDPPSDPFFDVDSAREVVANITPTAVASDIPGLIEAGLKQLAHHVNPHAELVIVTDGIGDGWGSPSSAHWQDLRRRLKDPDTGRLPPRLVLLTPEHATSGVNLAVTDCSVNRALVPAGREVGIRIRISAFGASASERVTLRVTVDGRPVSERTIDILGDGVHEELIPHTFPDAGSHLIEARIDGARDLIAGDDTRCHTVQVESDVEVILVEGEPGTGSSGSLGLVAAALDPDDEQSGLFRIRRVAAADFQRHDLESARVVILGDVPALDPDLVAAIEAFVVAGGGVFVGLGPHTDLPLANRFWVRGGHGFLPATLSGIRDGIGGIRIAPMSEVHGALSAFTQVDDDVWRDVRIRRYVQLSTQDQGAETERLIALDDGIPLTVMRRRGYGHVALFASSLNTAWNDLPRHAVFVPFVRSMVAELGAVILPSRNLIPGDRPCWVPPLGFSGNLDLADPEGRGLVLSEGIWEGHRAMYAPPARIPGGYHLRGPGVDVRFAVAPDPRESTLQPLSQETVTEACSSHVVHLHGAAAVSDAFAREGRHPVEFWRWLLGASVLLLFIESLLTAGEGRLLDVRRLWSGSRPNGNQ